MLSLPVPLDSPENASGSPVAKFLKPSSRSWLSLTSIPPRNFVSLYLPAYVKAVLSHLYGPYSDVATRHDQADKLLKLAPISTSQGRCW
jgi:hypothetical protein